MHKELVQCLPPEEVRTATFVKQAMANTKVRIVRHTPCGAVCIHHDCSTDASPCAVLTSLCAADVAVHR